MVKKSAQITEQRISDTFYYICFFITLIALGMTLVRFFTRGEFPPAGIGFFYVGVLIIYSLHKEALRWIIDEEENNKRRGEYFVYIWIIITAFLYLVNFACKDYFHFSSSGQENPVLIETAFITLEVGAVFILSRILKIFAFVFKRRGK